MTQLLKLMTPDEVMLIPTVDGVTTENITKSLKQITNRISEATNIIYH